MAANYLPAESVLDRVRADYRAECDAEIARETALHLSTTWLDTAVLLWGDILAAAIAKSESPTALRLEAGQ